MTVITRIAREEWRSLLRNRVAVFGLSLLAVLMLVAAFNAWEHQRNANAERAHYQAQANHEFAAQPDRHPHRVAHYGHFLFRPLNVLAAFDPGIDAYTGNTLFVEAHRQNSANFGDVRQSSMLLRFGQLTPAFVLQVLASLLLVFVGHACVARERETGTLRVLWAQGVSGWQLLLGKLLGLAGFAGLVVLPALLALGWMATSDQTSWASAGLLCAGYLVWLLLWSLIVVLVSSLFARSRDALLALLAAWTVLVILLPRWLPEVVSTTIELPTRFENEIHATREYLALGNAHDPNDPKFAEFRDKVLKQYGVTRVEDLPVNFKGLVGIESERKSTELFNRYATATLDLQDRQNRMVDGFGWLSPTLAIRRLSMTASGTDQDSYRRFLEQGEQYRYDLIQHLNRLQAQELSYADDTSPNKENRIAHTHWQAFPPFQFEPRPATETWQRIVPASGILLLWLVALAAAIALRAGRLGRALQ